MPIPTNLPRLRAEDLDPSGVLNLTTAIGAQAAQDWREGKATLASIEHPGYRTLRNCLRDINSAEVFFLSDYFRDIMRVPGAPILERLKKEWAESTRQSRSYKSPVRY